MNSNPIKAVVFDCDGTLVDSEVISLQVLVDYVAEFGLQISHHEAMQNFAGNELSVVLTDIERRLGKALPGEFLDTFRSRQIELLGQRVKACSGAANLLQQLTVPYCVASNAPLKKIDVCLQSTKLSSFFSVANIFSAYTIEKWKPAPDLFLMAAASLQVPPESCAVIEDSRFGIEAGLAAGMQVFAYCPHSNGLAKEYAGRVQVVQHLDDLLQFLPVATERLSTS